MATEKQHILIVEDDIDGCDFLKVLFDMDGYQTTTACTIAEAEQLLQQERFDLYLLDTKLPDGSGIDLCRQIRVLNGDCPIVFYSGDAFPKDKELAIASGAQAYIVKPTDILVLEKTVATLIQKSKSGRAN